MSRQTMAAAIVMIDSRVSGRNVASESSDPAATSLASMGHQMSRRLRWARGMIDSKHSPPVLLLMDNTYEISTP